jgi:hypothetical protein
MQAEMDNKLAAKDKEIRELKAEVERLEEFLRHAMGIKK